ncbi:MAG: rim15, signal transduction response regulator [Alyxoria varia]|nr:MAG: rim15, signal transduction response regulator [Alyxoria varia]
MAQNVSNVQDPPNVKSFGAAGDGRIVNLRGQMERTHTSELREEGKDLRDAAEQSQNVILDLTLDGLIRWVSPTWPNLVGTEIESLQGKPISDLLVENKDIFAEATNSLRRDDSGSKVIRFSVHRGHQSPLKLPEKDLADATSESDAPKEAEEEDDDHIIDLEAQGILLYDRATGAESHTMWMIRPSIQREITIDLPVILVESLGVGAEMLAKHLTGLAEAGANDPQNHPPPLPVLCRICERQITPWWFPKHTELCLQEHRAEAEVEMAQERLSEHRNAIVKVLDSLEAQAQQKRIPTSEGVTSVSAPEYKGMAIGPTPPTSSSTSSGAPSPSLSRDASASGRHHQRARSFTVRRPLARIVELVLDLCDTAAEISTPVMKDTRNVETGEFRTQSPQSEGRISQVLQWQSPSAGALENEAGLSTLCDDTANLSKTKVDAVLAFRRILEYSERIRNEFTTLVQECIDAALQKASRIAAGDSSGSSDESTSRGQDTDEELVDKTGDDDQGLNQRPPSAMTAALRGSLEGRSASPSPHRRMSSAVSDMSNSPRPCSTPRSRSSGIFLNQFEGQSAMSNEGDTGAESDSSAPSAARSQPTRPESPLSEAASVSSRPIPSRSRKRTSLVLSRALSTSRAHSPGRSPAPPHSPLRSMKARIPSQTLESVKSPLMSPTLSSSEYCSPVAGSQPTSSKYPPHRRESSAGSSEASRHQSSPHLTMTNNPQPRAPPPSIKDFEIIKPISKGAFGSVYLTKKKSTGDYYAIKALKKADMVAKNQVANVKAERAILMWQGQSDFVAKLYWTFPSKDYIFLVMEYLNGGDCASLVRVLGTLPEDWAKKYLAEVILGVEHLHSREIVHRDLKPDNLLIDQKGHLKLTDFGLSRMGLIGRQKRALKTDHLAPDPLKQGGLVRSGSIASSRSTSFDVHNGSSPGSTPSLTPALGESALPSYFSLSRESSISNKPPKRENSGQYSELGDTDHVQAAFNRLTVNETSSNPSRQSMFGEEYSRSEVESFDSQSLHRTTSNCSNAKNSTPPQPSSMMPPPTALFDPDDSNRRFVGTPDYLAPETINGIGQDETSDWWSLGCILFEFLFGYPPFHADTPDKVFENILSRNIDWPEEENEVSEEAKDILHRLMCLDPGSRLGSNAGDKFATGGEEIRNHPWFADIDWDTINKTEASFVPAPENPEDTEYFDPRGATTQDFSAEFEDQNTSPIGTPSSECPDRPHDALSNVRKQVNSMKRNLMPLHIPKHVRDGRNRRLSEPVVADDFGQFSFKNLPVLEKANKDVIQKLRAEAMQAQSRQNPPAQQKPTPTSASPPSVEASSPINMPLKRAMSTTNRGASPSANSQSNASPSRGSQPASPLVQFSAGNNHERRKTSSESSQSGSLQPGFFDIPRLPASFKPTSNASSPIRTTKISQASSIEKDDASANSANTGGGSPRTRSHTVGSNDGEPVRERPTRHQKHRSQVLEVSPSSSDNDDPRQKALLRVHRRRQSSKRMSQISFNEGPFFRPLDVLVCEDHPVSRLVMEKLLEKLRCRTILVSDGTEAMRYAMSSVKFDIIMTEVKLPRLSGADVARMIRETKNANIQTPIVAVTGYLKELQAPHHFDALVEKPPTLAKLTDHLSRSCHWKPPPPGWVPPSVTLHPPSFPPSALRNESIHTDDSPNSASSGFPPGTSISYRAGSSRDASVSSASVFTDPEHRAEETSTTNFKSANDTAPTKKPSGLGISETASKSTMPRSLAHALPALTHQDSAPANLNAGGGIRKMPSAELVEAKRRAQQRERIHGGESGDDEDEELGNARARSRSPRAKELQQAQQSSYLSTEMMRSDSQNSVVSVIGSPEATRSLAPLSPQDVEPSIEGGGAREDLLSPHGSHFSAMNPPFLFSPHAGKGPKEFDMEATPTPQSTSSAATNKSDDDPTPKPSKWIPSSSESPSQR